MCIVRIAPAQRVDDAREAHRSRTRRRPRPREGLLLGIRAGIVSVPFPNCTPRLRGWRCFQGGFYLTNNQGLKPLAQSYCPFGAETTSSLLTQIRIMRVPLTFVRFSVVGISIQSSRENTPHPVSLTKAHAFLSDAGYAETSG